MNVPVLAIDARASSVPPWKLKMPVPVPFATMLVLIVPPPVPTPPRLAMP